MRWTRFLGLCAALLAGAAQAQKAPAPATKPLPTFLDPPPASAMGKVTANDVLADLRAVNMMMTDSSEMALQRATTKSVTDLARTVAEDTKNLTAHLTELTTKKKIVAQEKSFDTGEAALSWAERNRSTEMHVLEGQRFETAWLASVVDRERFALGVIDLGRNAKLDPDVMSYLNAYEKVARANFQQAEVLLLGGTSVGQLAPTP